MAFGRAVLAVHGGRQAPLPAQHRAHDALAGSQLSLLLLPPLHLKQRCSDDATRSRQREHKYLQCKHSRANISQYAMQPQAMHVLANATPDHNNSTAVSTKASSTPKTHGSTDGTNAGRTIHVVVCDQSPDQLQHTSGRSEYHRSTVCAASSRSVFQSRARPCAVLPYAILKFRTLQQQKQRSVFESAHQHTGAEISLT